MLQRTAQDVFEEHLRLRAAGKLDEDLQRNYADDVRLFCSDGVICGRDAVRDSAERLGWQLPGAKFEFTTKLVDGDCALLLWRAESDRFRVEHGADSFVIRDGRIVAQTIYYALIGKAI